MKIRQLLINESKHNNRKKQARKDCEIAVGKTITKPENQRNDLGTTIWGDPTHSPQPE